MNITYRQFISVDKKAVAELIKALYREDSEGKPISNEQINKTIKELLNHPEKGTILLIEKDGEIIGYSILVNFCSNEYGGNILDIDELFIKPEFCGKGIGTRFIKYLVKNKFSNSVAVRLEVMPSNKKALQLYERMGFISSENKHLTYELDG
jgi:GNAT superfamily N-acetyltransferase